MAPDQIDFVELPPLTLKDVADRLKYALDPMGDADIICINGSLFAAEELTVAFHKSLEIHCVAIVAH